MIIGIDEVGRGCWAGPLVAAAVGLSGQCSIVGLNDSKKLTAASRKRLAGEIKVSGSLIGLGWVWPREINKIGLTESVRLAMQRSIDEIEFENSDIIIDGNINYLQHIQGTSAIIKADGMVPAVSAASIIAKVARDTYMYKIAKKYPEYGFEKHVGYGTRQHIEALGLHGVLPIHRTKYKPIRALMTGAK